MRWEDVLFAHWPVAPETLASRLPAGLTLDTYDGDGYLGIVPFVMTEIRPRLAPVGLSFGELNLRTYVCDEQGTSGVYFFSLDADDPIGVHLARRLFQLPYYRADMDVYRNGEVRFRSRRLDGSPASFDATYAAVGERFVPEPGSLPAFLTERYRFYTESAGYRLYYGDIDHEPWELAPAQVEFRKNDLFDINGFEHPTGQPLVHHAAGIDVTADRVHRVHK